MTRALSIVTAATGAAALLAVTPPQARAEELVTYEIFSDTVGRLAGIEYRDTSGKHLIQDIPLPWSLTVPVANPTSPANDGAELRADWRPTYRTAATVGLLLVGKFVTVRISQGGQTLCESILDVGNATCYGSSPHRSTNESSPGNLP